MNYHFRVSCVVRRASSPALRNIGTLVGGFVVIVDGIVIAGANRFAPTVTKRDSNHPIAFVVVPVQQTSQVLVMPYFEC